MAEARVRGVFTAEDKTKPAVNSVRRNLKGVESSFKSVNKQATKVGKDLSLRLTAPIVGFGLLALRTAGQFEASMKRVEAKAKVAGKSIEELSDQAKNLGKTTQFSARQAAEAQEILATSGFDTSQIFKALPGVLNLAAAGNLELADAASFASATLKNFNLDASQTADVSDLLAKGSLLANQQVSDLGAAMSEVGAIADAFGIGITDTAATLSVLAEKNVKAEKGGVALRNLLLELKNPTASATKFLNSLGLSVTKADGSLVSMNNILKTFNEAGINAANAGDVFNKKVAATFIQLEKAQDKLKEFNDELANRTGAAAEVAAKNLEGFEGELKLLVSAFEGLQIAIADAGLLAFATDVVKVLAGIASSLADANPELIRMGLIFTSIVAALGPVLLIFGQIVGALGTLTTSVATIKAFGASVGAAKAAVVAFLNPVGLAVAAVAALVAIAAASSARFRKFFAAIAKSALKDLGDTFLPILKSIGSFIKSGLLPILGSLGAIVGSVVIVTFKILTSLLKNTVGKALNLVAEIVDMLTASFGWLSDKVDLVMKAIAKGFKGFFGILRKAAKGLSELPGKFGDMAIAAEKHLAKIEKLFEEPKKAADETGGAVEGAGDAFKKLGNDADDAADGGILNANKAMQETLRIMKEISDEIENQTTADFAKQFEKDEKARQKLLSDTRKSLEAVGVNPDLLAKVFDNALIGVSNFDKALLKVVPTIRRLGNEIIGSLSGAIDIFDQDSQTTWQRFEESAKTAINRVVQEIINLLIQKALFALLSLIPGVGQILAAGGSAAASTSGPVQKIAPGGLGGNTFIEYKSFLPGTTNDFVRANVTVQRSDDRATRFLVGVS